MTTPTVNNVSIDSYEKRLVPVTAAICEKVRELIGDCKPRGDVAEASWLFYRRIGAGLSAILTLRDNRRGAWENEAITLLRSMYDAHLQLLFMMYEPLRREERARLFLDYVWVEKYLLIDHFSKGQTRLERKLYQHPRRDEGMLHVIAQTQRVGPQYLTKNGRERFRQRGEDYLAGRGVSFRDRWYPEKLSELARVTGYATEYDLIQRLGSMSTHSSAMALQGAPTTTILVVAACRFALRSADIVAEVFGITLEPDDAEEIAAARPNIFDSVPEDI